MKNDRMAKGYIEQAAKKLKQVERAVQDGGGPLPCASLKSVSSNR